MSILDKPPFSLDKEAIEWVETTLSSLTIEEKAGQLFCVNALNCPPEMFDKIFSVLEPGGVMYRATPSEVTTAFTRLLSEKAKVPLLISGNLEKGGAGMIPGGTQLGSPMAIAASGDAELADKLGTVCGREGRSIGASWAYAPIVDIDYNWHNPITNTRTFGSDPDRVAELGARFIRSIQKEGVAACFKHFPGDGRDERDQHLVTTVNDLGCEEWMATYGKVYKACIEAGSLTCMAGQIMQPAWSRRLCPGIKDEDIRPGSQSKELLQGLLRGELGFNGLICTDSSTMAGFLIPGPRSETVPGAIAAGADMLLFNKNLEEDYGYMLDGIRNGIISSERLDEAVTRILGVKAALKLHLRRPYPEASDVEKAVSEPEHKAWAVELADKSITLVKEEKGVLPLSPGKYPRILLYPLESRSESTAGNYGVRQGAIPGLAERLRKEGFDVSFYERDNGLEGFTRTMRSYKEKYDLLLYVANFSTKSNQTVVRLEWDQPMGANCPHFITSIPTVFVSLENPYHLADVPRIRTFINCYASTDTTLDALVEKLMGRSLFKGKSPSDPFCGLWDARL